MRDVSEHAVRVGWIGDHASGTLTCPDEGWEAGVIPSRAADYIACAHRRHVHGERCPTGEHEVRTDYGAMALTMLAHIRGEAWAIDINEGMVAETVGLTLDEWRRANRRNDK